MLYKAVPNLLSLIRLISAPIIWMCVAFQWYWGALILFGCSALTDLLDGLIARHWACTSWMGKILDPIADKVLILTVMGVLVHYHVLPGWFLVLAVIRDSLILGGGALLIHMKRGSITPHIISKLNTVLQMAVCTLGLGHLAGIPVPLQALVYLTTAAMTASAGVYGYRAIQGWKT